MKHNITDLTHEDIVSILSTALYGCEWTVTDYDHEFYNNLKEHEGDCFEDACADVLLNGGTISIADSYAEGEIYGSKGKLCEDEETVVYTLDLQDFLKGCNSKDGFDLAVEILVEEEGDYYTANDLLQVIMFGEVIYG